MTLTPKQEKFVQELIKGKSQREAYKIAFKCVNWKNESIDSKACNLFKQDKVRLRYNKLMEKATENFVWSFEMAQKELLELLNDSKLGKDRKHVIGAIKELNQITGLYKREVDTDKTIKVEIKKASDRE